MKMVFKAKRRGNLNANKGGDIYVSGISGGSKSRYAISVRFSQEILDRLRWRIGDRVYMELERDGSADTWTFIRVPETDTEGLKLSGNGHKNGPASVRRTTNEDEIAAVFPNCKRGYQGFFVDGDNTKAVFAVDLNQ